MKETLIFGHKNPDTDSIISSIVTADLEKKMGNTNVKACRLGNINKETEYVLHYFHMETPKLVESVSEEDSVILVDHNGFAQSVTGIENANITKVIDHHNISGFETKNPLFYMAQPVGCTATILYEIYHINGLEIDKTMAGLMLSAIISDTLLLKSPITTQKDIMTANQLASLANLDLHTYGLEMLKAGTDLSSYTAAELINIDSKTYHVKDTNIQIAQINTVSIEDVLMKKEQIEQAMTDFITEHHTDLFMLAITDILNNDSQVIALGNRADIVEKAYNTLLTDHMCFLKGIVSRKKQMVPVISDNV